MKAFLLKIGIVTCLLFIFQFENRAQEFILPTSSFDIGVGAGITTFKVLAASPRQSFGFSPSVAAALHMNLNKLYTHTIYTRGNLLFAGDNLGYHTNGYGYELGYKVSRLQAPFGLITGLTFKNQIFNPQHPVQLNYYWLSQIDIPAEVYWSKLLPSNDAVLLQLASPIFELVSATEPPDVFIHGGELITIFEQVEAANQGYSAKIPLKDYTGIRFTAAFVNAISKTAALKIAYVFQYYNLYEPENIQTVHTLGLQYQF